MTDRESIEGAEDTDCRYITAQNRHPSVQEKTSGKIIVAFDDVVSINYYGEMLRGYYFADGGNIMDAIEFSINEYEMVCRV